MTRLLLQLVLIAIFLISFTPVWAQKQITGTVVDSNEVPIPGVHVYAKAQRLIGTSTNAEGDFQLILPNEVDSIHFSAIGYVTKTVAASGRDLQVQLIEDVQILDQVVIKPINAVDILTKVTEAIPINYNQGHFGYDSYYRETIRDTLSYLSIAEAVFQHHHNPDHELQIKLTKGRTSSDVAKTRLFEDFHPAGGPYLMMAPNISQQGPSFMRKDQFKFYNYDLQAITKFDGRDVYVIAFDQKDGVKKSLRKGKIYIDQESHAVVAYYAKLSPRGLPYIQHLRGVDKVMASLLRIKFRRLKDSINVSFIPFGEKWYLNQVTRQYQITYQQPKKGLDLSLDIRMDNLVTAIRPGDETDISREQTWRRNQMVSRLPSDFDQSFWGEENVIRQDTAMSSYLDYLQQLVSQKDTISRDLNIWQQHYTNLAKIQGTDSDISIIPFQNSQWKGDQQSSYLSQTIAGDFTLSATVQFNRRREGKKDPLLGSQMGGLIVRNANGSSENNVMLNIGIRGNSKLWIFRHSTSAGKTKIRSSKAPSSQLRMKMTKAGSRIDLSYAEVGAESWINAGSYQLSGDTLEVGFTAFAFFRGRGPLKKPNSEIMFSDIELLSTNAINPTKISDRFAKLSWKSLGPFEIAPSPQPEHVRGVGRINSVEFHPTDTATIYAASASGGIWKTTDYGKSWYPKTDQLPVLRMSDIAIDPINPQVVYIATGDMNTYDTELRTYPSNHGVGIYKSVDGGENWSVTGLSFSVADRKKSFLRKIVIHPARPHELITLGSGGLWKSTDEADSWRHLIVNEQFQDIEMDPVNPEVLYATTVKSSSSIMKSTDFGETWQALETYLPQNGEVGRIELAIAPSNGQTIYALAVDHDGGMYGVYQSKNAGDSWHLVADPTTSPNILGRLNGDAEMFFFEKGGQGNFDLALMVDPHDENKVYAGGVNVWGSPDGGKTWDIVSFIQNWFGPTIHQDIHHITYNPIDKYYYVANDGGVDRTRELVIGNIDFAFDSCVVIDENAGNIDAREGCYRLPTVWERLTTGMAISEFYGICLSPHDSNFLMGGTQDNSYFIRRGDRWVNAFDGDGMYCAVDSTDPTVLYAGMEFGRLEVSYDNGNTVRDNMTTPVLSDLTQNVIWSNPLLIDPHDGSLITGFSDLWKSTDRAKTWNKITDFPLNLNGNAGTPITAVELDEQYPGLMYVARAPFGAGTELWKNVDGNWRLISGNLLRQEIISDIMIAGESEVYISYAGFRESIKVFYSKDRGNSWLNISANLGNSSVNDLELLKDNTVVAATDDGVFWYSQTSQSWQELGAGLPNAVVQKIVYDPRTEKIYAATFGRGIWEIALGNR